jgi:hypothetical protein
METQVRTPSAIFGQPQRFLVPLFQRPYVWNKDQQWEPLWNDLERVATRLLNEPHVKHAPHFLGAVVLQHVQNRVGELQERIIIDGQQRLTTMQILLDALHTELLNVGATVPAGRIEYLIQNDKRFCTHEEDRFKVWPTNRDRPAFNEVMAAPHPVKHETLQHSSAKLVSAHKYFAEQANMWLANGENTDARADAIERSARELVQLVVIDLAADENAQEIFETLNARGAQLTAADLIKNFVFQKLLERGADVESAYEQHWKEFETAFWEAEVSAGRFKYQRSSLFINHWLISRTGKEVVAREVFSRFKRFAEDEKTPMEKLLQQMSRAAAVYKRITEAAQNAEGPIDRVGLFAYRTDAMESDVMKPVLMALLDPEKPPLPPAAIDSTLDSIESWITRRMLVRASTKGYNQMVPELIGLINNSSADLLPHAMRKYLEKQSAEYRYWPDDEELRRELGELAIYRRLSRGRLRMILEGIEDDRRGYSPGGKQYAGTRVPRGKYSIEHVMPQKWEASWASPKDGRGEERARRLHMLGNLTLITSKLNSSVSNGPWFGESGKRSGLMKHDLLLMNRDLDGFSENGWTDDSIAARTKKLVERIVSIWPVPPGHKSSAFHVAESGTQAVDLADLLAAGMLVVGQTLIPRPVNLRQHIGRVLSDGRIDLNERIFETPSGAAQSLRGGSTNGWWFWFADAEQKRSLNRLRREYIALMSPQSGTDDPDDEEEADV